MTQGPIIIIDDDQDDQDIYKEAIKEIGILNEIRTFGDAQAALDYLYITSEQPFLILSDINMPGLNGIQLKSKIQQDSYLSSKAIPFIFISTNAGTMAVRQAYSLNVQGYFEKPHRMEDIKAMLRKLFAYWETCKHINNTKG